MFYDIDRSGWETFSRSFDTYLERFKPFIPLFERKSCEGSHLLVFIDERHQHTLSPLLTERSHSITLIPINRKFLEDNIFCWSLLPRERDIMNSIAYKNLIHHRSHCPETRFPEYTLLNHSKIDFLNYVISNHLSPLSLYAWVDFGFFSTTSIIPTSLLDTSHFDITKINYTLINDIEPEDKDIFYTLRAAPEKIGGFFFIGKKDCLQVYQKLYHSSLLEYQNMGICDDDQAVALYCYFKRPELFSFPWVRGWHNVFKAYSLKKTKKVISFCLWGEEKRYTVGLLENLKLASFFYPDFICYIYIHYKAATPEYLKEIQKSNQNHNIIIKKEETIRPKRCMLWRIEPLMDKSVDLFISRDIDTRIFSREVLAVRQWMGSSKILHIMRDHPQHYNRILGGMFGVRTETLKNYDWIKLIESYYKIYGEEENDQHFLQKFLYNMTSLSDKMIHDEIKKYELTCLPFPSKFEQSHFTGCYIYEDGSGEPQTEFVLNQYLTYVLPHRWSKSTLTLEQKLDYIAQHMDCIYIIHYAKLKERRMMMEQQLQNHLLDLFFKDRIHWVDTFDREYIDYTSYKSFYSPTIYRDITKGEIANMTAHRFVFDSISSSSSSFTYSNNFFVIEDDCIFKENFIHNLYQTLQLLEKEKWDMVCFGGPTVLNVEPARALDKSTKMIFEVSEIEIFTPTSPAPCTVSSMLYNKQGISKILSSPYLNEPYLFPSDHALWEANKENKINMKWVQPFITYEGSKNDLFSTSFTERGF